MAGEPADEALCLITRLLRRNYHRSFERQLAEEIDSVTATMRTEDHMNAVAAFN